MVEWVIEPLVQEHERGAFSCGKAPLDVFIQRHAAGNARRGVSRVFVATRPGEKQVLGYYASSAGVFQRKDLPPDEQTGLPGYPLPTVHLGRLAVDLSCRGQRLGETLLFHSLKKALQVADLIGVYAFDLWAKDADACAFYLKYGFRTLQDDPHHLYLPMGTVQEMFELP